MKIIRNLEIYSSIDSDGRIKVDYNELKKKEEIFNEMLECWAEHAHSFGVDFWDLANAFYGAYHSRDKQIEQLKADNEQLKEDDKRYKKVLLSLSKESFGYAADLAKQALNKEKS